MYSQPVIRKYQLDLNRRKLSLDFLISEVYSFLTIIMSQIRRHESDWKLPHKAMCAPYCYRSVTRVFSDKLIWCVLQSCYECHSVEISWQTGMDVVHQLKWEMLWDKLNMHVRYSMFDFFDMHVLLESMMILAVYVIFRIFRLVQI